MESIRVLLPNDPFTVQVHQIWRTLTPCLQFKLPGGVFYHEDCIYILEGQKKLQVLKLCHNIPPCGGLWPLQDLEFNCKLFLVPGFLCLSQELYQILGLSIPA